MLGAFGRLLFEGLPMKKVNGLVLTLSFASALSTAAIPVSEGLVTYLSLDGGTVGGNAVIQGNPQPTADRFGNPHGAIHFNGGADSIRLSGLNLNTAVGDANTVSFWMKWSEGVSTSWPESASYPFSFGTPDAAYGLLFQNQASLRFGFAGGHGDVWGIDVESDFANSWLHVTAIFVNGDTTLSQLYINGELQSLDMTFAGSPSDMRMDRTVGTEAAISGYLDSPDRFTLIGDIDEVAIFNRELSANEVWSIYSVPENSSPLNLLFAAAGLFAFAFWNKRQGAQTGNDRVC